MRAVCASVKQAILSRGFLLAFAGTALVLLLSSFEGLTRIFIHAPLEYRLGIVMERHQLSESNARTLIKKTDKKRSSYYNFYTSKDWGSSQNYDITINSSVLGVEKTAQLLKAFVLARD